MGIVDNWFSVPIVMWVTGLDKTERKRGNNVENPIERPLIEVRLFVLRFELTNGMLKRERGLV